MSYDVSCYNLAEGFLADYEILCQPDEAKRHLAQVIQDAIEDELDAMMVDCTIAEKA